MMTREIRWHRDRSVPVEIIREIENRWNVRFPETYVNIVTQHDGAKPMGKNDKNEWEIGEIDIPKWHGKRSDLALLRYMDEDKLERKAIFFAYNAFKDCLPEKIFPFANNGGGDLFFFDYRKNVNEPAIVFLDHEETVVEEDLPEEDLVKKSISEWQSDSLYPICNSFSELLEMIKI